jgi:ribosomal-protein-alanine N-acetyltransferase
MVWQSGSFYLQPYIQIYWLQKEWTMHTIETERLILKPFIADAAEAATRSRAEAEKLIGYAILKDWLDEDLLNYLPVYIAEQRFDPSVLGWGMWLIIHKQHETVIGDLGFKGRPKDGAVEIGYKLIAPYRRQGYMVEAVTALMDWGFSQVGVHKIVAECLVDNFASIGVLEKIGMKRTGTVYNPEEGSNLISWEKVKAQ